MPSNNTELKNSECPSAPDAAASAQATQAQLDGEGTPAPEAEVMIDVNHVTMAFNMASEQLNNLKEYFIKLAKHELFFKEFIALDDVSFTVRRGDVYGIVGTNGSGKSTVLKIIAGVLDPTRGTCSVKGTIAPLIELGAGFDYELTARENIYLNGALLGYSHAYIDQHFDEIVDFAELEGFLDLPMKNYSSGMTARIAFAIATIIVPDILIVDEALAVGDVFFQEKCERRINSLINDYGTTVLFVSHSIAQVERICKHAIWIEKGHKVMEGDVSEVCSAYRSMEYIDFVRNHNIMGNADSTADPRVMATRADLAGALEAVGAGAGALEAAGLDGADVAAAAAAVATRTGEGATPQQAASPAPEAANADAGAEAGAAFATKMQAVQALYAFLQSRRPFDYTPNTKLLAAFHDASDVPDAARGAVCWAVEKKLLTGKHLESGHLVLAIDEPIPFIALAKMFTRMFKSVLTYPDDVSPTCGFARSGCFDKIIQTGLMQGHQSGLFAPAEKTNKAQACTVMHRAAGTPEPIEIVPFEDASEGDYFYNAAQWAYSHKLASIKGGSIRFEPEADISVDELCEMAANLMTSETATFNTAGADKAQLMDQLKATISQSETTQGPAYRSTLAEVAIFVSEHLAK